VSGEILPGKRAARRRRRKRATAAARPAVRIVALGAVIAMVAAAAGAYALTHAAAGRPGRPAASGPKGGPASRAGLAGWQGLRVLAITPKAGTRHVNGASPVEVRFSARIAADSPLPTLSPRSHGRWQVLGSTVTFTPSIPFPPSATIRVRVPAGPAGVRSVAGGLLAGPLTARFSTGRYSQRRLSEMLSQLGYLPLSWAPAGSPHPSGLVGGQGADGTGGGLAAQEALAYSPPAGTFSWDRGYPALLTRAWRPDGPNLIVTGAVMAFESQHGMPVNGVASREVWAALLRAAAAGQDNRRGYTYAIARKAVPETLTIWHDGRVVLRSLANTGIPVAPTADGTFPVYLRYRFQIMSGTNPDGSHYADPVSFVSYFNGGDAVHYFPRGSYGFQQSLGCVELPYGAAARAWPYLSYGSLVTVAG
jgi:L,D-transpeptidase catalytic domain/Bacterial Ig-like domain